MSVFIVFLGVLVGFSFYYAFAPVFKDSRIDHAWLAWIAGFATIIGVTLFMARLVTANSLPSITITFSDSATRDSYLDYWCHTIAECSGDSVRIEGDDK